MRKKLWLCVVAGMLLWGACSMGEEAEPFGPLPSEQQLAWHALERYAFIHFSMNTFTDMEWGTGAEDPSLFNPSALDCRQWVEVLKGSGFNAIILTAKHHDGFCLWPTATTEHSVKNSPWKNGQGDVVKELADACREAGLKFGVYLSPWDRNSALYGQPEYIDIYRQQLRELLTGYGEIFELWIDGANGGTGYYGGANENRSVDRQTYYDWETTFKLVRELQPQTLIFSDGGPDVRWVGNEKGFAGETNWCLLKGNEFYPGTPNYRFLPNGQEEGTEWIPAEVDVSIRPGWYYHQHEDTLVKSLKQLTDIYYHSVGRNATLLLNVPPDRRGLIAEPDKERLHIFNEQLKQDFMQEVIPAKITANVDRGRNFRACRVSDGDESTYWGAPDGVVSGVLTFDFDREEEIGKIVLQEPVRLGQRIRRFSVEAEMDGEWKKIGSETTIGYKRILRLESVKTRRIRVNIEDANSTALISEIKILK